MANLEERRKKNSFAAAVALLIQLNVRRWRWNCPFRPSVLEKRLFLDCAHQTEWIRETLLLSPKIDFKRMNVLSSASGNIGGGMRGRVPATFFFSSFPPLALLLLMVKWPA